MKILSHFICFSILFLLTCAYQSYHNYKVVRIHVNNENSLRSLQSLFATDPLDVWSYDGTMVVGEMDILFSPKQFERLVQAKLPGITIVKILEHNLQQQIEAERAQIAKSVNLTFFQNYRKLEEIQQFMQELHQKYPDMTEIVTIGETVEKRKILTFRIHKPGKWDPSQRQIWFSALQHAREWISPPVPLYAMQQLLERYANGDARVKKIIDNLQFHFTPIINVDGYVYTWTSSRMWRKNRRKNNNTSCMGVDLNRNWAYHWVGEGSSTDPCSDVYRGAAANSEPETQCIVEYFKQNPRIVAAIDFHSYGELILRSWQCCRSQTPDEKGLMELGAKIQAGIKSVHGRTYRNIQGTQLYPHSGAMVDFFYGIQKIYGYTIELRGSSFAPPASEIIRAAQENFESILIMSEYALTKP